MSYNAPLFLFVFLPLSWVVTRLVPRRWQWLSLLLFSWVYYLSFSPRMILVLLFIICCTYLSGLVIESLFNRTDLLAGQAADRQVRKVIKTRGKRQAKLALIAAIVIISGVLVLFKYLAFFTTNLNQLLRLVSSSHSLPLLKLGEPLGISFFTLQALSYLIDVFRRKYKAERHWGRLALWLSFFPQIMEGPICRYDQTAAQLYAGHSIRFSDLVSGGQRIIWGLFKKVVIADRLNPLVTAVFDHPQQQAGLTVLVGAFCYTMQLYADFSGSIDIVIGSARLFGIALPENFNRPFFSRSASEFWRRWHISLGAWLRDYIFYSISFSHRMKQFDKKHREGLWRFLPLALALAAVWLCNGLWHGAGWQYIFYGFYYFVLILASNILEPVYKQIFARLGWSRESRGWQAFQIGRTFLLVVIGELIFRSPSLGQAFGLIRRGFSQFRLTALQDGRLLKLGLDKADWIVVGLGLVLLFGVESIQESGLKLSPRLRQLPRAGRWALYLGLILVIVIAGAYGRNYGEVPLIYAGF
ncbi:MBOAT family protein [Oscillospiraceae bacterium HV4-5-C5C]|nr:MBOAT family protein [Oscillospiraceae bacterium HV4-5-C5C]